tara:strand:- start:743 stop:916 length:174 start_codon:yes stop_codon:yes gene_type:complete
MLEVTEKFLKTIDDISTNDIIKDEGYYIVYLCMEIGKKYVSKNNNINKFMNIVDKVI